MANFAESAPRAHLVHGLSGRSAAWTWASSQVRPQQLFSLFCVSRRTGHVSNLVALKLRIPRHEETMHGAVAV